MVLISPGGESGAVEVVMVAVVGDGVTVVVT